MPVSLDIETRLGVGHVVASTYGTAYRSGHVTGDGGTGPGGVVLAEMTTFENSPAVPPNLIWEVPPGGTAANHWPGDQTHLLGPACFALASESHVKAPG
jgi:hypothetical protein